MPSSSPGQSPQSAGTAVSVRVYARDELARRRLTIALAGTDMRVDDAVAAPVGPPAPSGPGLDVVVATVGGSDTRRAAVIRRLRRELAAARVVVVCPPVSEPSVRKALEAGADGLVWESDIETTLAPVVLAVSAGQVSVPERRRQAIGRPALSHREKQILGLVVIGLTNAEIASRVYLAESTVKSHLSSAFAKLGVHSRNDAVARILDPEERLGPGILAASPDGAASLALALAAPDRSEGHE